jgi:predicted transcriptional regulator
MTHSTKRQVGKATADTGRRTTKRDQLVELLGAKAGVDTKSLSEKLGWQQHTTRAAISGLRKAGYEVAPKKPAKGGISKYRILSMPAGEEGAAVVTADGA